MISSTSSKRERFEPRVRRNIIEFAVRLALVGEGQRRNGIELAPGEFTTRDAECAALAGNHMREKARRVIEAMTSEGLLTVTRTVERGRSHPWVIRRASTALLVAERRSEWDPDAADEEAFTAAVGDELSRCGRVLRSLEHRSVISTRGAAAREAPSVRQQAKAERLAELLTEATRMGHSVPGDVEAKHLNQLLHEPPSWLWHLGQAKPGLQLWEQRREDTSVDLRDRAQP